MRLSHPPPLSATKSHSLQPICEPNHSPDPQIAPDGLSWSVHACGRTGSSDDIDCRNVILADAQWPEPDRTGATMEINDQPPSPERSATMARVRSSDTTAEILVRRTLHRLGYRFVLHDKRLPGRPDLAFPSRRARHLYQRMLLAPTPGLPASDDAEDPDSVLAEQVRLQRTERSALSIICAGKAEP
jgi:DNA mismatch endonuclease Vsr